MSRLNHLCSWSWCSRASQRLWNYLLDVREKSKCESLGLLPALAGLQSTHSSSCITVKYTHQNGTNMYSCTGRKGTPRYLPCALELKLSHSNTDSKILVHGASWRICACRSALIILHLFNIYKIFSQGNPMLLAVSYVYIKIFCPKGFLNQ